jgi:hypothetical protein
MNRKLFCIGILTVVTLGYWAPAALAQVSETDVIQALRSDILADRQAVVAANLGLTDAEGTAFWPVYREYRAEMGKVGDRMQKLIQDYSKVYDKATPEQAKSMTDQMMAFQREDLKVRETYLPKFRKVLSDVKVARFLQIENKMDAIIRLWLADEIPLIEPVKK